MHVSERYIPDWISASQFTTTSRLAYASLIRRMLRFIGKMPLSEIRPTQLTEFFRSISSESTRQRAVSAAKSYFGYLHKEGIIESDPMKLIHFRNLSERSTLDDVRLVKLLLTDGVPRNAVDKLRWADYVLPTSNPDAASNAHKLRIGNRLITISTASGESLKKRFAQFAGDRKAVDVLEHLDEPIFPPNQQSKRTKTAKPLPR